MMSEAEKSTIRRYERLKAELCTIKAGGRCLDCGFVGLCLIGPDGALDAEIEKAIKTAEEEWEA